MCAISGHFGADNSSENAPSRDTRPSCRDNGALQSGTGADVRRQRLSHSSAQPQLRRADSSAAEPRLGPQDRSGGVVDDDFPVLALGLGIGLAALLEVRTGLLAELVAAAQCVFVLPEGDSQD